MIDPAVRALAARLQRLEAAVADRTPQLGNSSLEASAILEHDINGALVAQYGRQWDGSSGAVALNGAAPPQPSAPTVTPALSGLVVSWDGLWADPVAITPMDYSRVEIHVSTDPNFDPAFADTIAGTFETSRGGSVTISTGSDFSTRYVRLVARTFPGRSSVASAVVAGLPDSSITTVAANKSQVIYAARAPGITDFGSTGDLWYQTDPVRTDLVLTTWVSRGGTTWQITTLAVANLSTAPGLALGTMAPYVPELTGVNLGAGSTLVGQALRIGNLVFATGTLVIGSSGFSAGSGRWYLSLPFLASVGPADLMIGTAQVNADGAIGQHLVGFASALPGDPTKMAIYAPISTTSTRCDAVGGTGANVTPGGTAWAPNGFMRWSLTYVTTDP